MLASMMRVGVMTCLPGGMRVRACVRACVCRVAHVRVTQQWNANAAFYAASVVTSLNAVAVALGGITTAEVRTHV